ncbi:hypothetical protein [Actinomadura sp. DC4]|uniref:hypothetical protein n=1 Tax=Actinomadura sp. DC4 TaxID=3055069 RepID=UPI0025B01CCE|nr:hypothetical protein [Actinomadura sp. DC4]MDN3357818.1 hypothetical protein [Actinomadura sp. DC4]
MLLAYLVLWDLEPAHRIERALRVVRRRATWEQGDGLRRRVLRRCVRTKHGGEYRPRGWPAMRPADATLDAGMAEAIRRLSREERVAYVLQRVEGLTLDETVAELRRLRVPESGAVARRAVRSVDSVAEPDAQRTVILALDLETVALSPRWPSRPSRGRWAVVLAGVLAMAVAAAGVVLWLPEDRARLRVNTRVDDDAVDLDEWPARGDRVHDGALLGRARDAWEGVPYRPGEDGSRYGSVTLYGLGEVPHPRPGPGTLVVLFAGTVGPARTVLLSDGGLFALYSEGTRVGRSLTVETAPLVPAGPLAVGPPEFDQGTRQAYLLPPGTRHAEIATLADTRPAWRSVTTRDGVVIVPNVRGSSGCRRTLFRVSRPTVSGGADFTSVYAGLENPVTTTRIVWQAPGAETAALDTRLARDVICEDEYFSALHTRSVAQVDAKTFWHGALPEGRHRGAFVSLVLTYGAGQPDPPKNLPVESEEGQTVFVDQPPDAPGTVTTEESETDESGGDAAYATASWHGASGRWYMIAGGAPAIARMWTWGRRNEKANGRTLIVRGPMSHATEEPEWDLRVDAVTASGEPGSLQ